MRSLIRKLRRPESRHDRSGSVLVLAAAFLAVVFAFCSFSIDVGYIALIKARLQNAADAATLSAVVQLKDSSLPASVRVQAAIADAQYLAQLNLPDDGEVLVASDVAVGEWDAETQTFIPNSQTLNAVRATVRRASANGNALPLFFAPVLGHSQTNLSATSIAVLSGPDSVDAIPMALRDPNFGPVDPEIAADNPGKDGPSQPANGDAFVEDEVVTLFLFGKGKASPVHLTLDIEDEGYDTQDVLAGESDPTSVPMSIDDEYYVHNEGTGGGGYGSALEDRLDLSWNDPLRTVYVPVVSEHSGTRNGDGEITGTVKIVGFVKVHLDEVVEVEVPDPEDPGDTIEIEILRATALEDQTEEGTSSGDSSGVVGKVVR